MLRRTLITGVLLLGGLAIPAVSQARSMHVVNNAGLSSAQVRNFKHAGSQIVNGDMHRMWGTPTIGWGGSNSNDTIVFYNRLGPVEKFCGSGAAGCHGVKNGRPYAVVDTNRFETGRIWSVAGTHELAEMWVDPYIKTFMPVPNLPHGSFLVEVGDPVEDFTRSISGVQTTDYVFPNWYRNVNAQQDDFGRLHFFGANQYGFSCPTGFASYWNGFKWLEFGPGAGGGGCMLKGPLTTQSKLAPSAQPEQPALTYSQQADDHRVAIFPVK